MTLQNKISLFIAYSTYAVLFYSIVAGQPTVVMEYVTYSPAPLFAILILLFTPQVTINKGVAFFAFCCILYYAQFYIVIDHIISGNNFQWLIPIMSCLGSVFISLVYSLLFLGNGDLKKDILMPLRLGLLVSIPTLICSLFEPSFDSLIDQLLSIGLYSIFPFWILAMSKHLLNDRSA